MHPYACDSLEPLETLNMGTFSGDDLQGYITLLPHAFSFSSYTLSICLFPKSFNRPSMTVPSGFFKKWTQDAICFSPVLPQTTSNLPYGGTCVCEYTITCCHPYKTPRGYRHVCGDHERYKSKLRIVGVYKLPLPPCSPSLITKHPGFVLQNRNASHL
jgi:hypothetical protein